MPNVIEIRLYSAELQRHFDFQHGSYEVTGFGFDEITYLRRLKSICKPSFNEISESTADILLLPVSKNKRPPPAAKL